MTMLISAGDKCCHKVGSRGDMYSVIMIQSVNYRRELHVRGVQK